MPPTLFHRLSAGLKQFDPAADLYDIHALWQDRPYRRFELGDSLPNGSTARVEQAALRASKVFEATVGQADTLWFLVHEYGPSDLFGQSNDYLHTLLATAEAMAWQMSAELRIGVGFDGQKALPVTAILTGIARAEMGQEPCVGQRIVFFDLHEGIGFYMYDDRGCVVWGRDSSLVDRRCHPLRDWYVGAH